MIPRLSQRPWPLAGRAFFGVLAADFLAPPIGSSAVWFINWPLRLHYRAENALSFAADQRRGNHEDHFKRGSASMLSRKIHAAERAHQKVAVCDCLKFALVR
jgi:hypothetical protein